MTANEHAHRTREERDECMAGRCNGDRVRDGYTWHSTPPLRRRVTGLDLSLSNSGVAQFIEGSDAPRLTFHEEGTVDQTTEALADRIARMGGGVYTKALADTMEAFDDWFVIEGPSMHSKHGKPDERAGLRWYLTIALKRHGRVVHVPPASLKSYWTANGNAPKPLITARARTRYPDTYIRDDNVADALALAHMGASHRGFTLDPRPPLVITSALAGVRWPSPDGGTS